MSLLWHPLSMTLYVYTPVEQQHSAQKQYRTAFHNPISTRIDRTSTKPATSLTMSGNSVDETSFPLFLNQVVSCDLCSTWFTTMGDLQDHLRVCADKPEDSDTRRKAAKISRRATEKSDNAGSAEGSHRKQKARGFVPAPHTDGEGSSHTADDATTDSNPEGLTDNEDWATNHPARIRGPDEPPLPAQQTPPQTQRTREAAVAVAGDSSGNGKRPSFGSDRIIQKKSRPSAAFTFSSPTTPNYHLGNSRGPSRSARVSSAYTAFSPSSPGPKTPEQVIAQALKQMVASTVNVVSVNERPRHERQIAATFQKYRKGEEERFEAALARHDYSIPGDPLDGYITQLVDERFNFRWEFMNDGFALNAPMLKVLNEQVDVRFEERVKQLKDVRGWEQGPATVRDAVAEEIQRRAKLHGETGAKQSQEMLTDHGGSGQKQDQCTGKMHARDLALAKLMGTVPM
ncbi:hypothetical protein BST61_g9589 [Cercospora zeina]